MGSGDFSKMAHNKLEAMGWKVHTRVRSQLMPAQLVKRFIQIVLSDSNYRAIMIHGKALMPGNPANQGKAAAEAD